MTRAQLAQTQTRFNPLNRGGDIRALRRQDMAGKVRKVSILLIEGSRSQLTDYVET
jgi:hypothetical protein